MSITHSRIEQYRMEIRAKAFTPMSRSEIEELRQVYYSSEFAEMIGGRPSPQTFALLDMFLSEEVPPDVSEPFVMGYVCEEIMFRNTASRGQTVQ